MENRFPIFDVSPVVHYGDELIPAKAISDEAINVRATVIREGHDGLVVEAVLVSPKGVETNRMAMREYWPGTDRYEAELRPTSVGVWHFYIEALSPDRTLSSRTSLFPIYAECETAVLASDVGGIPEVVADGVTGELIHYSGNAAEFESAFTAKINALMSDRDLLRKYGEAGRVRAIDQFSWDTIAQETVALYKSLIK